MDKVLGSVDVWFKSPDCSFCVNVTPNEAVALMSMPSMAGIILKLIPRYELSSLSEPKNKE